MELRQLQCFVAVAEELHFRKAGERLGLSQPALSDRISALEHELGLALFFRTTRQVSLTQAGSEFLRDAKRILADIDKSVSKARHTADSGLKTLRVSGVDEAISMLLPPALIEFRKRQPSVHVDILEISSSDYHTQELAKHRTDIAFVRKPPEAEFLQADLLYHQGAVVVLPSASELAGRALLSAADIRDHPIIGFPKRARPILHDLLWNSFRAQGWQPDIACEVIDKSTMLQLVAHGVGIGLAPAWIRALAPAGLICIPYQTDSQRIELYVARRATANSKMVEEFVDVVKDVSSTLHPDGAGQ
ncbi:LysR family transcriptional regulator [Ruegeria sp. ANG10]|uniref:LysR family transcriptional regulator n=1 Tax=Ruegeria sp. ANG10 TaxID=3042467 RepID=UPI0034560D06